MKRKIILAGLILISMFSIFALNIAFASDVIGIVGDQGGGTGNKVSKWFIDNIYGPSGTRYKLTINDNMGNSQQIDFDNWPKKSTKIDVPPIRPYEWANMKNVGETGIHATPPKMVITRADVAAYYKKLKKVGENDPTYKGLLDGTYSYTLIVESLFLYGWHGYTSNYLTTTYGHDMSGWTYVTPIWQLYNYYLGNGGANRDQKNGDSTIVYPTNNAIANLKEDRPLEYPGQYNLVGEHEHCWAGYNGQPQNDFRVEVWYDLYDENGVLVKDKFWLDYDDKVKYWQSEKSIKNGEVDDYEFAETVEYQGETYVWKSTKITPDKYGPGSRKGKITINGSSAKIVGRYELQKGLKVYIHLMLDTKTHEVGDDLCVNYTDTGKIINYTGGAYKNGVATYSVKKNDVNSYALLSEVAVNGTKYELVNSYLQWQGKTNKDFHVDKTVTTRNPGPITETLHIVAEYKLPTSIVNVWCVEDTATHAVGSGQCVHYANDAGKRIFAEPTTYPIEVGEATKIPLQASIEKDGKTYTLINSHINDYNWHIGPESTAFYSRNIIIDTPQTVNITAEYEESIILPEEITLVVERLNPLFEAQIMSDNRAEKVTNYPQNDVASTNYTTQKYNVLGNYGIPTSETQYAQLLSASRNLLRFEYVKRNGETDTNVTITKNYPYMWWTGCYVVKGCGNTTTASNNTGGGVVRVDSSNVADGYTDSRWRHDTIGCSHITIYNDRTNAAGDVLPGNCYGGNVEYDADGRAYGTGGTCPNGGTCCDWTYNACQGEINDCAGHEVEYSEWIDTSTVDEETGEVTESGYTHYWTEIEYYGSHCIHTHHQGCVIYDSCNGHPDKYCTQTNFWCNGTTCPGHSRTYHGTFDPQCEVSSSCIHPETYSISRTYKYNRKWQYYYAKAYDAYKLGNVDVYNATLGWDGSATLNTTKYSLANVFYRGNEFLSVNSGSTSRWIENGHVMKPLSSHTITHNFNQVIDDTTHKNKLNIKYNSATGKENYNSKQAALNVAMTQAAWDLGLGGNMNNVSNGNSTYTYDQYKAVTDEKMKNDIWMLGETKSVLRVKNDYLWHDGQIMEMYNPTTHYPTTAYYAETNPYKTDSLYDTNATPDLELYDFTEYGIRYAYYMSNRTDVTATGRDPEVTTSKTYTSDTTGKAGNKTQIRTASGSVTINGTSYGIFVTPTTVYNGLNTSYKLGWGTRATGATGLLWYQNGITIPSTIRNDVYTSFATAEYTKVANANIGNIRGKGLPGSAEAEATVAANQPNVNSVTVHTPVYISATIVQGATSTQVINQTNDPTPLELDMEYVVRVNTTGQHRLNYYGKGLNQKGYGNKNYGAWIKRKQIHFPYDVYIKSGNDYEFLKAGEWMDFPANSNDITFKIPVWTIEKIYAAANLNTGHDEDVLANSIVVRAIAENDPAIGLDDTIGRRFANKEGTTAATENRIYNQISYDYRAYDAINTNIVGKIYDFKFEYTDDDAYIKTMETFAGVGASELPFGQKGDNPGRPASTYALKLGSKFKYTVKTKGTKSSEVKIVPTVYFVKKATGTLEEVDVYYEIAGNKYEKLTTDATLTQHTTVVNSKEKPTGLEEIVANTNTIYRALKDGTIFDDNWSGKDFSEYTYRQDVTIGTLGQMILGENVRLRYDAGTEYEANDIYGLRTQHQIKIDAGSAINFIKSISQWHGECRLPSTTIFTRKGVPLYNNNNKMQNLKISDGDGYLVVFFNIITKDTEGKDYLSYQLPTNKTQWLKEDYAAGGTNYAIELPNGRTATYTQPLTTKCAGVAIYEAFINTEGAVIGPN